MKDLLPLVGHESGTQRKHLLNIWHWDAVTGFFRMSAKCGRLFLESLDLLMAARIACRCFATVGPGHVSLFLSATMNGASSDAPTDRSDP